MCVKGKTMYLFVALQHITYVCNFFFTIIGTVYLNYVLLKLS